MWLTSLMVLAAGTVSLEAGSILREVYQGIPGTAISDLTNNPAYPDSPSATNLVSDFFEAPTNVDDNYGQRMHGYVVPPVTGNYTFWIASDDNGALYLSTDDSPANVRLVCSVSSWTSSREWGKLPEQKSAGVSLVAGRPYYILALQKEGGGGDNLAVRWLRPDGLDEGPIPATYFLPWGTSFTAPVISQQPTNTVATEGQMATFSVQSRNLDVTYQWLRNGVPIPGGTASILSYGPVTVADDGALFSVALANKLGATNSTTAHLSVSPDTVKPVLVNVTTLGPTNLQVGFSEPVNVSSGPVATNYALSGGAEVTGAAMGAYGQSIILSTTTLIYGTSYTLTVNGVQDRAQTPNTILPQSQLTFVPMEFVAQTIGNANGSVQRVGDGAFDVAGGGLDYGGAADAGEFAALQRTGDFDLQVRVAGVLVSNPFLHAGLMARATLDASSVFAAVFTASAQVGCFFESRASTGAKASQQSPTGGFPANYPQTWLRLRRSGSTFTGYAGFDGQRWVQLGSANLTLPSTLYVGLGVSSDDGVATTKVNFRDYGPTVSTATTSYTPGDTEPLWPSSRRTGIVFSEIMYHPKPPTGITNRLEFVELFNAGAIFEDLGGWQITGDVNFTFPPGFRLQAGQFAVVAADPAALTAVSGARGVVGPFTGALNNHGGTLKLIDNNAALKLEVTFSSDPPWPAACDGAGHSLVLSHSSYGENSPKAWTASDQVGGSPGEMEARHANPWRGVVINEFLAHTDPPLVDYLELYNRNNSAVDLSGCYLSDDAHTNKFRFSSGTSIAARGFLGLDATQLGFRLNAAGETLYLVSADGTRVIDAVRFGPQENGVSSGRCPDGSDTIRRLAQLTPGAPNGAWRQEDIVINEIMYAPISLDDDDQYVELYNRSAKPVDLTGWAFTSGIDFTFAPGTVLAPGGYAVVARNLAHLRANYPQLDTSRAFGDFKGTLKHGGERLALAMPHDLVNTNALGDLETNHVQIVISELTYEAGGHWGHWAAGGGSSLELVDPEADPLLAANWADSDESAKAPWTIVEGTGKLDQGDSGSAGAPNRLHISIQGEGECLVDELEVFKVGGTNLVKNGGFESGATGWSFFGNHSLSSVETGSAYAGNGALHVRGQGDGDTGINSIRTALSSGLASGATATIRAKIRWLAGWPEVLFRLQGNWLELSGRMTLPTNLGTPGQPNSRAVAHAGPAIYEVGHSPALPLGNAPVVVTCRVSDPQPLTGVLLEYRLEPATSYTSIVMRDDGTGGDAVAGDGVYSATLPARGGGTLVAFRIRATDETGAQRVFPFATAIWPVPSGPPECLVRWGDPVPVGSFPHYHLWNTRGVDAKRSNALDNTFRDCTVVYGTFRVIYNAGFRDKGSPYHAGAGDWVVTVPSDDLLLGVEERILAATGNGGEEDTQLRGQVADWICRSLGLPFLHRHYLQGYRNGTQLRTVMEDLEEPSRSYAKSWFPGGDGDFYKVAVWFEFQDNNSSFDSIGATIEPFRTTGNAYKLARYRWMFQRRSNDGTANNYSNLFDLVTAANASGNYVNGLLTIADIEQWMRIFGYHRVTGNWDSWSFNVGQNMFIFKQPGRRWVLMPWDIDFVVGLGNGTTDALWNGQDPRINVMYSTPAFRRMLWRLYEDAIAGPMLVTNYSPQIVARRAVLLQNNIVNLGPTNGIYTYLEGRRKYIAGQLAAADAKQFAISNNGGRDFTNNSSTVTLSGTAPFAVATILVNGGAYPVSWTGFTAFSVTLPLTRATNLLNLVGVDRLGRPVPGATTSITVYYPGSIQAARGWVVINEISYHPLEPGASFVELFNRSTDTTFDLSDWRLNGVAYTFPKGAVIAPNGYLILAKSRAGFAAAYGSTLPVFDEFPGSLDNAGETLRLIQPGPVETVVSDVRYDDKLPWPPAADGQGPSLQLVDASRDTWRVANWTVTSTNDPSRVTPGRANAGRQALAAFPALWLNEILPNNVNGPTDNTGQRAPFIELYNAGSDLLDLSALYLTADATNLTQWQFPASTLIAPQQFLVFWADGHPERSAPGAIHTGFALDPTNGLVALTWMQGSPAAPAVVDFIRYRSLPVGRSIGSFPDGEPRRRRSFYYVTAGATNNPTFPEVKVTLNEFMAENTRTLANPVDGKFDDWFELFNAGTNAVDLTGYYLTDNLTNSSLFEIPPGYVVPAEGFLLVWADGSPKYNSPTNADLHVNFKLSKLGDQIGLFSPDGNRVDGITFGQQTNDVSMGRFPDGADVPLEPLASPTPGTPNFVAGANHPPVVEAVPSQTVAEETRLDFIVSARDADVGQTWTFSLGADAPAGAQIDSATGAFHWTPTEEQGPGAYAFTVRATDNGVPPRTGSRSVNVTVTEVNRPPTLAPVPSQTVDEGVMLIFNLEAADPDQPPNVLTFSLDPDAPAGAVVDPSKGVFSWVPSEDQGPGTYQITARVTDNGTPPLDAAQTFTVTVREVNNPPVFAAVAPQTVDEGQRLVFTVRAVDPDTPPASMTYSLDGTPPAGLQIDPATGEVTWTPTEAQGPGDYPIIVRATENNVDHLSSAQTFGITVNEVNQPPVLAPIADVQAMEGSVVAFVAHATDADLPPQPLTFSLGPGAPVDAGIEATSGAFRWVIPDDYGAATNTITVRVTDAGPGNLAASRSFDVAVRPRFKAVINEIMYRPATNGAEFIELANPSAITPWDLSGLRLRGSNLDFTFPARTQLAPGGFVCVVSSTTIFGRTYGASLPVAGAWTGVLGTNGDDLRLIQPGPPELVLDRVRFTASAPWPVLTTQGSSLQLVDNHRDNSRAGNWTGVGAGGSVLLPWQRVISTGTASSSTLYLYLETIGDVYMDDLKLVAGTDPDVGDNLLLDGDFEGAFPGPWTVSANLSGSALSTSIKHGGNASLHMVASSPGTTRASSIYQDLATPLTQGAPYTLSYWYLPNTNGGTLTIRLSGSGIRSSISLAPDPSLMVLATPGKTNNVSLALPEFPALWLSEVEPTNATGLVDHEGAHVPWMELVNAGSDPVPLSGWFLSTNYGKLALWPFPTNSVIGGGQWLVIFADGQPTASVSTELHTSFQLDPVHGSVILSRQQLGVPAVVDYLDYQVGGADQSFGHYADDLGGDAVVLPAATPGAPNPLKNPPPAPVLEATLAEGGTLQVIWASQPGAIYRVEYTDSVAGPWRTLTTVSSQDVTAEFRDPLAGGGQRFYRVVVP